MACFSYIIFTTMIYIEDKPIVPNPHMVWIQQLTEKITKKIGKDYFAYLLLCFSAFCYPLCFIYFSQRKYHTVQANMVRGITIFVTHYFIARFLGIDLDFKGAKNNKYLLIRNGIMIVNQVAYTFMHFVVPLPVINILNISGSIFAFLCDYWLYGTKIHAMQIPGILAGCLGVVVTVNGEFIMSKIDPSFTTHSQFENYLVTDIGLRVLFGSLYILASLLWAYGLVIQKQIVGVSGLKISYHSGVMFTLVMSLFYPVVVTDPIPFSQFLIGCAVSGLMMSVVQILFTSAFNMTENSGILTMLTMLTLIPSYFFSMYSYDQSLNPVCLIGLVLLAWGLVRTIRYGENQKH